ncbi:MAG TPA: efflux transporter outer membrane subunit [Alphaproteobacteria bacterium]|nr:efflux transporter outer membrane subunit [Alphaproteobacteria bacterium]
MRRPIAIAIALLLLGGCEAGPDYTPPKVTAPAAFKEAKGHWLPAKPAAAIDRGDWWAIYNDATLGQLEKQVAISNQNLKAAAAAWQAARDVVEESRATLFPTADLGGGMTHSGGGGATKTVTRYNANLSAGWVPDLWGRIRRTVESNIANAQASQADLASARLSAQAALAADYFTLRAEDELKDLLDQTAANDKKALAITQNEYSAGTVSEADVLSAKTQLEGVEAQAINAGVARAQLEHAIAVLIGKPPAEVTVAPGKLGTDIPATPPGLPSKLLERRPDIASAERLVAAANAQIGVATAAWFPDLTLSASYGFASNALGSLIQGPSSLWSLGPSLAETLFDAGARSAKIAETKATYAETVANYRQTVLTAFQQVEDNLAALRILAKEAAAEDQAVADAQKSETLVLNQYKAGIVNYSSVLVAQNTALADQQTALSVRENRFAASVGLIEALGGGWDVAQLEGATSAKHTAQPK